MALHARPALGLAAALLLSLSATGASAAPVEKRTERVFFHCTGTNKVQNVEAAEPSWNTTAPAASVQSGAGCGHYSNLLTLGGTPLDEAAWAGTFTGNLKDLTVELYNIHASTDRAAPTMRLSILVEVDGHPAYSHPVATPITAPRTATSTGAADKVVFSLRGIGLATEEGVGTAVHQVRITIGEYNETQSAWVWDTTEVPAGVTFNPTGALQGRVLDATPFPVEEE